MFSVRRIRAAPLSCFPQQRERKLCKKTDRRYLRTKEMKITVLWYVMLCSLEQGYQYFNTLVCTQFQQPHIHRHDSLYLICTREFLTSFQFVCKFNSQTVWWEGETKTYNRGKIHKTGNQNCHFLHTALYVHISVPLNHSRYNKTVILKSDLLWQFKVRWSLYMLIL